MNSESTFHRVIDLQENGILLVEDGNHGEYRPLQHEFGQNGVAFIRAADMDSGRILFGTASRINETARTRIRKGIGAPGDVLLSHKGTVGKVAFAPLDAPAFVCSPQTTFWRTLDQNTLDRRYLYYFLSSRPFHDQLASRKGETDMADYVSLTAQRQLVVTLPHIMWQRRIAHILGTLDDKIELNRRMNETLESLARALFKSWFVDFDPVRVKANDLIRDGILEIGDGYRAKHYEFHGNGLPFIRAANLNNGLDTDGASILCAKSVRRAGNKISRVGDVAMTTKGTVGRKARVSERTPRFVYAPQVCYWRSTNPMRLHPAVLYCWMQSDDFTLMLDSVSGQTDMAPYVSLQDQREFQVPMFGSTQAVIGQRIDALLSKAAALTDESRSLTSLRDTLLPKLLSGELRVSDAEAMVEEVA
jgi:type I restriction enzyme, S subunit